MDESNPIFIGGMFKSGTSLLRAMMGRHSKLATGLETYWFDIKWENLNDTQNKERFRLIREFFEISEDRFGEMVGLSRCAEDLLDFVMTHWARKLGKERWAEKTPGNIIHIDRIKGHWPHSRIVHIIRDPRDVYASLVLAKKWDSVSEFMIRWANIFRAVDRHKNENLLTQSGYLEVRYEELVSSPLTTMATIWEFVGLPYEDAPAHFDGESNDFNKVFNVTGKKSTTLASLAKPLSKDRRGLWSTSLSKQTLDDLQIAAKHMSLGEAYENACFSTEL